MSAMRAERVSASARKVSASKIACGGRAVSSAMHLPKSKRQASEYSREAEAKCSEVRTPWGTRVPFPERSEAVQAQGLTLHHGPLRSGKGPRRGAVRPPCGTGE